MVLIVDNFDSFTYNLYNYFLRLGAKTIVKNRDEIDIDYIKKFNPSHIVLSPGPGRPTDDKILFEIIDNFKDTKKDPWRMSWASSNWDVLWSKAYKGKKAYTWDCRYNRAWWTGYI